MKSMECPIKKQDFQRNYELLDKIGENQDFDKTMFLPSTPSICYDTDKAMSYMKKMPTKPFVIVNRRFVNYHINEKGEYINQDKIETKNVVAIFDVSNMTKWKKMKEFVLDYDTSHDTNDSENRYVGLEDVRLLSINGNLMYNANRGLGPNDIKVENGIIDTGRHQTIVSKLLTKKNERKVEKNWVFFNDYNGETKHIYEWAPLTIGIVRDEQEFHVIDKLPTPAFFKYLRGSTTGVLIENEVWFICHLVSYEDRRHYYHVFVVLDAITYEVKRYSKLFTFEGEKVEYTLGFIYIEEMRQFMMGYSVMDRETKYILMSRTKIDDMMIENQG